MGLVGGSAIEGRDGVTAREREASIPEPGTAPVGSLLLRDGGRARLRALKDVGFHLPSEREPAQPPSGGAGTGPARTPAEIVATICRPVTRSGKRSSPGT